MSMYNISPTHRLAIYRHTLRHINKYMTMTGWTRCYGLCGCVANAGKELYDIRVNIIHLPELMAQKPLQTFNYIYWWEAGAIEPRILALENAILSVREVILNES